MEKCQRCDREGPDRRTLRMSCFYQMNELRVPFERDEKDFTLRVCKNCRATWMQAIENWFNSQTKPDDYE